MKSRVRFLIAGKWTDWVVADHARQIWDSDNAREITEVELVETITIEEYEQRTRED